MKYRLNIAWWMAVAIIIGLLATGANAQVIAKDAKFTLPFKANWEGRVLPPGDYTMWVSRIDQHAYCIDLRREGFQHTMVVLETPGAVVGKQAALVAEVRGLQVSVRELHLPKANLVLKFPELKNAKTGTAVAKVDPDTPPVPVLIALK
jgi:hypothetical protein